MRATMDGCGRRSRRTRQRGPTRAPKRRATGRGKSFKTFSRKTSRAPKQRATRFANLQYPSSGNCRSPRRCASQRASARPQIAIQEIAKWMGEVTVGPIIYVVPRHKLGREIEAQFRRSRRQRQGVPRSQRHRPGKSGEEDVPKPGRRRAGDEVPRGHSHDLLQEARR